MADMTEFRKKYNIIFMKNTIFKAHPVSVQSTKAAYQGGILFGVKPVLHNPFFWGGRGNC